MYAIIRAGGKQFKVAEGDVIEVELLKEGSEDVEFTPLFMVDDDGAATTGKDQLAGARVRATVVGDSKGPKIKVMKFKNKTGYRRHTGHRQHYTTIQISGIEASGTSRSRKTKTATTKEATSDGT